MASLLRRIGAFSTAHKGSVLVFWALLVTAFAILASTTSGTFSTQFRLPGTESQRATELIAERTPGANPDAASGTVVFAAPGGRSVTDGAGRDAIEGVVADLRRVPDVADASDPIRAGGVSRDRRTAFSSLQFTIPDAEVAEEQTDAIRRAGERAERAGLRVEYGGAAAATAEEGASAEVAGVVVALVVLAFTFGSLLAAGMPLLTGVLGVALGLLGLKVATSLVDLNDTAQALVTMLGLAVGIDYTLLIVSRHRSQVHGGMPIDRSIAHAVGTAGSAVVFAGLTVVVALVALAVTGIPFLAQMGIAAAAAVAAAVVLSLTLVPALLALAGRRAVRGKHVEPPPPDAPATARRTLGMRWVGLVLRHRIVAVLLPVAALLLLAAPALDMRLGLPNDGTENPDTTQRQAYDLLERGFGAGVNGPLAVVVDLQGADDPRAATERVVAQVRDLGDVGAVAPPQATPAGNLAIVNVTPRSGPSSPQTERLVADIRDRAGPVREQTGARVLVSGQTATAIDITDRVSGALVPYLAVVVGLAALLLLVAFRSVLVPLTAIGGFLLTIAASFGVVTLVFQEGVLADALGVAQTGPLLSLLPTLVIGVIFGLAMDYQVFLVSRMREQHARGVEGDEAVGRGFAQGARVVTAAALIMIAVFCGFVIPDDPIVKSIGLAFATGVLIDAFVVRMTLIPAVMSLIGPRVWWLPRWLDRAVPDVDIEGTRLEASAQAADDRATPEPAAG